MEELLVAQPVEDMRGWMERKVEWVYALGLCDCLERMVYSIDFLGLASSSGVGVKFGYGFLCFRSVYIMILVSLMAGYVYTLFGGWRVDARHDCRKRAECHVNS